MLGHRDDVGASDFGNCDTAVGGIGSVEIDVIRADTSSNGKLKVLSLSQTLGIEIARVEAREGWVSG